jgi:pimeloyl-ACP methyl ester carboxylesterase
VTRLARLVVALPVAMVVALAGCTVPSFAPSGGGSAGGSDATTAPKAQGTVDWKPCPEVPREVVGQAASGMEYDCGSVPVPEDWHNPGNGEKFSIAMIRVRSKQQHDRIGSLLINPGGPGGSGIELAVGLSFGPALGGLPTEITSRFDVIGFDPRGVGRSNPIECIPAADQDANFSAVPDPVSQADFDAAVALNRKIATECGQKYGAELPFFSTEQAARDIDALRDAVGDPKLSYLGFSYGTLLGATYAQLFPTKIRAMVLDGAVDAEQSYVQSSETQAKGFERAFANFSAWCKSTPNDCPIAPDARKAVTDALSKAATTPVPGADGRKATPGWIFLGVVSSLYTKAGWQLLANALANLQQGDAKGIFSLADQYAERDAQGHYSNLFDANLAVNCADTNAAPSVADVRKLQGEWRQKYPLFGGYLAVGMLSCTFWPGKRDPYPTGPATGAPPIVVVGTTGDPATPYENTADLAGMLGVGHVLTSEGEGHTAYPSTTCIVSAVDKYLLDLTVPQEGLRCPPK